MTERRNQPASLFAACWKGEARRLVLRLTSRVGDRGCPGYTDAP